MDVSVIIPAYNRLWCLPRAIESCRNTNCQTEIIVVDDGSTDGTWEWLEKQTGLVIIKQENQGQTYAINKGVSIATGEYFRFIDSDDFSCPGYIDKQFEAAKSEAAQLVCSRVDLYEEGSGKITEFPEIDNWQDFLEIQLSSNYGSHFSGMLFHRSLVEQVPRRPEFNFREDRIFLLEVALLNPKMAIVPGCAGYWVQHQQQMQANYDDLQSQIVNRQHLDIYRNILSKLKSNGCLSSKYKQASCTVLWPLAHWIAKQNIASANEVVKWIFELDPEFQIPENGALGFLYKNMGFTFAERLLKVRRSIRSIWN